MTNKIHARTITALAVSQRLLGQRVMDRDYYSPIEMKRIFARVRITKEVMKESGKGAFINAIKGEINEHSF
jgi:hypothetical protein